MALRSLLSAFGVGRSPGLGQVSTLRSAGIDFEKAGNLEMAFSTYKILAEQGYADCQSKIGGMYAEGIGIQKDDVAALKWIRKAAEQGNADAQCNLGTFYKLGRCVPQSDDEAEKWYAMAAAQGHATALNCLGHMRTLLGIGTIGNAESAALFRLAAERGDASAQYNLGIAYLNGHGVSQDYRKALEWFYKAAEQGHEEAQYNIGIYYYKGQNGDVVDPAYVLMWFMLAAHAGVRDAVYYRDRLTKGLNKKVVAKAKRLAKEWISSHPKR